MSANKQVQISVPIVIKGPHHGGILEKFRKGHLGEARIGPNVIGIEQGLGLPEEIPTARTDKEVVPLVPVKISNDGSDVLPDGISLDVGIVYWDKRSIPLQVDL